MKLREKGLTLAEVLITASIFMVAGAILVNILLQNNNLFVKQSSKVDQGLSLNNANLAISDSIRNASSVLTSSPTTPVYSTDAHTLVLQLPSLDSSGNVISGSFDYRVIVRDTANPKILRQLTFPTPPSTRKAGNQILVNNLSAIDFSYLDASGNPVSPASATKVGFSVNLLQKSGLTNETSSASGVVSLRNK